MTEDDGTGERTDDGAGDHTGDAAGAVGTDAVQCWLVEREYTDKGMVTLIYATPDGERAITMQRSSNMLAHRDVTAARDVDPTDLEAVDDPDTRERYAKEAERTHSNNDPDDAI